MGQIRAEVSRDRLQLDRDNARRQAERDQLAFNNPMNDGEDEEAPSVSFVQGNSVNARQCQRDHCVVHTTQIGLQITGANHRSCRQAWALP